MITFGTSGWRGIIADEFTFDNVRLVTQAIARYVQETAVAQQRAVAPVVIGYDTRFHSERFAEIAAAVLAANGITALLCNRDTPTPVIAFEILRRRADGGINFTASHNPPQYNGLKFSPAWGGPALPETTKKIERYCLQLQRAEIKTMALADARKQKLVVMIDPRPAYLKRIKELIDFKEIKKGKLRIATDVLYGTGAGYLDELLDQAGVRQTVTRNWRDVLFGGHAPEPNEENLRSLAALMKKESCHLGLATDGDADRFGVLDEDGTFINPNQVIALLTHHLVVHRKWRGIVARSVMTTHLIDKIAAAHGLTVRETPVGFKYIGEVMTEEPQDFMIGGEESGGLTIRGHVPEKDGILACLLMAELVATTRKPLKKTLAEIEKMVGPVHSGRLNFHLTPDAMAAFRGRLAAHLPDKIGGRAIVKTITVDGYKFVLADGSWLGIRLSGTEPVVRLYLEAATPGKLKNLAAAGKRFITAA